MSQGKSQPDQPPNYVIGVQMRESVYKRDLAVAFCMGLAVGILIMIVGGWI